MFTHPFLIVHKLEICLFINGSSPHKHTMQTVRAHIINEKVIIALITIWAPTVYFT